MAPTFFCDLPDDALRTVVRSLSAHRRLDTWRLKLPQNSDLLLLSAVSPFAKVFKSLFTQLTFVDLNVVGGSSGGGIDFMDSNAVHLRVDNKSPSFLTDAFKIYGPVFDTLTIRAFPTRETIKTLDVLLQSFSNLKTLKIALHVENYNGVWNNFVETLLTRFGAQLESLDFRPSKMDSEQTRFAAQCIAAQCTQLKKIAIYTRRITLDTILPVWEKAAASLLELELNTQATNTPEQWTSTITAIRENCPFLHTVHVDAGKNGCSTPALFTELLCHYGPNLVKSCVGKRSVYLYGDNCWRIAQACSNLECTFDGLQSATREISALSPRLVQLSIVFQRPFNEYRFCTAMQRCRGLQIIKLQVAKGYGEFKWDDMLCELFNHRFERLQNVTIVVRHAKLHGATLGRIAMAAGDLRSFEVETYDIPGVHELAVLAAPNVEKISLSHHGSLAEDSALKEVSAVISEFRNCRKLKLLHIDMFRFGVASSIALADLCVPFRRFGVQIVINDEIFCG